MSVENPGGAMTPRLVFDGDFSDSNIPQFLRGDETVQESEAIKEPETPSDFDASAEEPVEIEGAQMAQTTALEDGENNMSEPDNGNGVENEPIIDFDQLSVEELRRQQEEIERKIREKQEAEKKAVINQIVEVVNTYKIPLDELIEALGGMKIKRKGVKAKPKYRDPVSGAEWSGRGKEPLWIRGKDRKDFLIKD